MLDHRQALRKVSGMRAARIPFFDLAGMLLALAGVFLSLWVAARFFENIPHIEDEMTFVWQARVIAESGSLVTETPVCPKCFLVPFVVDHNGLRFGKYPPGWPVALAFGEKLEARAWVNPLLAGFSIWLAYLAGKRLFTPAVGLAAAFLMVISPFFLMNSGSLLSHAWSLLLTLGFTLAWLDMTRAGSSPSMRRVATAAAALCMGALALTRPLTAVGVALPFAVHAIYLLARGSRETRRSLLVFAALAGAVSGLYFLWQLRVTGDALLNPYTLWWPYDKIGFGPGVGVNPNGHTLNKALFQTQFSLGVGSHDVFGWPYLSYLFIPFGLWAGRKRLFTWLLAGSALGLVAVYLLYWTPAWIYGPRYYYEGLPAAAVLTGGGLTWLAGELGGRWRCARRWLTWSLAGLLVAGNLVFYLPQRLGMMYGLYDVRASDLAPFLTPSMQRQPPTLVLVSVRDYWIEYGRLLDLESPLFTSQFIFAVSRSPEEDQLVKNAFPERQVWEYSPKLNQLQPLNSDRE